MRRISCSITARSSAGRPRAVGLPEVDLDQPLDRGERVAQLVGDARGHLADGHHLLGPDHLPLPLPLLMPVPLHDGRDHVGDRLDEVDVPVGERPRPGRVDAQDAERPVLAVEGDVQAADDPVLAEHGQRREAVVGAEVLDERPAPGRGSPGRPACPAAAPPSCRPPAPPASRPRPGRPPSRPAAVPGGWRTRPRGPRRGRHGLVHQLAEVDAGQGPPPEFGHQGLLAGPGPEFLFLPLPPGHVPEARTTQPGGTAAGRLVIASTVSSSPFARAGRVRRETRSGRDRSAASAPPGCPATRMSTIGFPTRSPRPRSEHRFRPAVDEHDPPPASMTTRASGADSRRWTARVPSMVIMRAARLGTDLMCPTRASGYFVLILDNSIAGGTDRYALTRWANFERSDRLPWATVGGGGTGTRNA